MTALTPLEIVSIVAFLIMYFMNNRLSKQLKEMEDFSDFQKNVIIDIALGKVEIIRNGDAIKLKPKI